MLAAAVLEDPEFSGLLDAPEVPAAAKANAIRQAVGDSVGPLSLNLLCVLASRDLAHLAPVILSEYSRLLDVHLGIERAEVIAAIPLDSHQRGKTAEFLRGVVGKEVRATYTVDPQILGGLTIRVGDKVIDGSVRTKLREMRRRIVEQVS